MSYVLSPKQEERVFSPTSFLQPHWSLRIINYVDLNESIDTPDQRIATTTEII